MGTLLLKCYLSQSYSSSSPGKALSLPRSHLQRRFVYYFRTAALLEIDDLCEEWVSEPLHPPITEDMKVKPPVLESAAGCHTIIDGKEVVNFASANYLGINRQ
ncbi:unnamed protein product [Musa textilis]